MELAHEVGHVGFLVTVSPAKVNKMSGVTEFIHLFASFGLFQQPFIVQHKKVWF